MLGETCAFFEALYGQCDESHGHLVLVSAKRNRPLGIFPVGDGDALVEAARKASANPGCYYKTQLMDGEAMMERSKGRRWPVVGCRAEVKTLVSFSLDVDAGKSEKYQSREFALFCLEDMPLAPSLIVNSGGHDGGFHVSWLLKRPQPITDNRKDIQEIADLWCERLRAKMRGKLDKTSNLDRVLRVVGVPRVDGRMVFAHEYHPERVYEIKDFL